MGVVFILLSLGLPVRPHPYSKFSWQLANNFDYCSAEIYWPWRPPFRFNVDEVLSPAGQR